MIYHFEEGELIKDSVVKESLTTASKRKIYNTSYRVLDDRLQRVDSAIGMK